MKSPRREKSLLFEASMGIDLSISVLLGIDCLSTLNAVVQRLLHIDVPSSPCCSAESFIFFMAFQVSAHVTLIEFAFINKFHSTLLYFYSTFTLFGSILLYSTLLYFTLFCFVLLYSTAVLISPSILSMLIIKS